MESSYKDLYNIIEKIIKLRLNNILEIGKIDEEISNKIKNINENIIKNNQAENKVLKKSKDEKILTARTTCIKDMSRIIKNEPNLNYLPSNIIKKIKSYKDKNQKEKLSFYSSLWKELDSQIKGKYKTLCENKDFTNAKYEKMIIKMIIN